MINKEINFVQGNDLYINRRYKRQTNAFISFPTITEVNNTQQKEKGD